MKVTIANESLTGHVLIATPQVGGDHFRNSVILLCAHSQQGAMGLVVNKPNPELTLTDFLHKTTDSDTLDTSQTEKTNCICVMHGGPVQRTHGFVLHLRDYYTSPDTLVINEQLGLTSTTGVLQRVSSDPAPENFIVLLGYAGWSPGQLEQEIKDNHWHTCAVNNQTIFNSDPTEKYRDALASLGICSNHIVSPNVGTA